MLVNSKHGGRIDDEVDKVSKKVRERRGESKSTSPFL